MTLRRILPGFLLAGLCYLASPPAGAFQDDSPVWERGRKKAEEWLEKDKTAHGSAEARRQLVAEMDAFLDGHADEEWGYAAVAHASNWMDRNTEAMSVLRRYRTRFPDSTSIDQNLQFFFFNWGTAVDLRSLPDRFHSRPAYWTSLLGKSKQAGEPEAALLASGRNALDRMTVSTDPDGSARAGLAEQLLSAGLDPKLAEQAARSALTCGETMRPMDHLLTTLPKEVIERSMRMWNYPIYRSSLGWSLAKQNRTREAVIELRKAAEVVQAKHLRAREVFFRLGQVLERTDEPVQALDAYVMEIATGGVSAKARQAVAQLPDAVDAARSELPQRLNQTAAQWAAADPNRQDVESVDEPLGRFVLNTVNGMPFGMDSLRGKVVIIEFWASWCASCRPSMASSDRLQREFPDNLAVVAPAGDPLETQDQAAKFLASRGYRFVHLVDDPAQRALATPWIPVRVALDREGRVRVKETGASEIGIAEFEKKVRTLIAQ